MAASIHFPELRHYRIEYQLPLMAVIGVAAALLWPKVPWAGMICLGGLLVLGLPMLKVDISNARCRRQWARSFARSIRPGGVAELAQMHPGRYRLHARRYQGFGMNAIRPATLVEDTETSECFPVVPAVKDASTLADQLGLPLDYH